MVLLLLPKPPEGTKDDDAQHCNEVHNVAQHLPLPDADVDVDPDVDADFPPDVDADDADRIQTPCTPEAEDPPEAAPPRILLLYG